MSVSARKRSVWSSLSPDDQDRIVRMAWEDRTSFEAIAEQFKLSANEVVQFMRTQLDRNSFERWRRRANERGHLKHEAQRPFIEGRFKCRRQRSNGTTKGWK
jgi:uncharacterized protein (TIGR03643 family)